jgi:hypothetical protein
VVRRLTVRRLVAVSRAPRTLVRRLQQALTARAVAWPQAAPRQRPGRLAAERPAPPLVPSRVRQPA